MKCVSNTLKTLFSERISKTISSKINFWNSIYANLEIINSCLVTIIMQNNNKYAEKPFSRDRNVVIRRL